MELVDDKIDARRLHVAKRRFGAKLLPEAVGANLEFRRSLRPNNGHDEQNRPTGKLTFAIGEHVPIRSFGNN